jgi:hypothetical protein
MIFAWSARNAFSIVASTGPSSAPLAFTWIKSITVQIEVAWRPLLYADEHVARQQAVSNLSKLAGIIHREALPRRPT